MKTYRSLASWMGLSLIAILVSDRSYADRVGDPAPPLVGLEWIKGQPREVKSGTNIFVVEFWAALSPASRAAIPTLNNLQTQYREKGVVVLGISDEPADKIRAFVEAPGAQISFDVAADDHRKTARNYMMAYGQNGIPHAFVVGKDARVLWHGHPMVGLEKALDQIIAGTYDFDKAKKVDTLRAEVDDYLAQARRGEPAAKETGRKLLAARTNDVPRLCDFAYRIVTDTANQDRDFALATEVLAQVEKVAGPKLPQLLMVRGFQLFETGKPQEGVALVKEAIEQAKSQKEKESLQVYLRVLEGKLEKDKKGKGPGQARAN